MNMRDFCAQITTRDWNNFWQINQICDACFRPQASIIGRCYVVILSTPHPLQRLLRFQGLEEWVVVVDFDESIHSDLGGAFNLFLLTPNTLNCPDYQAVYALEEQK